MSPFGEHAQNTADYQAMLKGDDNSGGAKLTLSTLPDPITIDCRYDRIQDDFILSSGQSPKLFVEQCAFLASDIPVTCTTVIRKGLKGTLKPNPTAKDIPIQLLVGGLEQGGLIYRFMLVDANYSA
jgi:hypothetical protein